MSYSPRYYDSSSSNLFLSSLYNLYEAIMFPEEKDFEKRKVNLFKEEIINKKVETIMNDIKYKADKISKEPPSFDILHDFAAAIRSMEITLFYINDPEKSKIYSDYDIDSTRKRNFYIKEKDEYVLKIETENKYDIKENKITITVSRLYGKELNTTFEIINRDCEYSRSEDVILINEINRILQKEISSCFLLFMTNIIEKLS